MNKFSPHSPIYAFATENLAYFNHMDVCHKKLLTIGGSLDQAIMARAHGAVEVVNVDINIHALHFAQLKHIAVQTMEHEEFIQFFMLGPQSLSYHQYKRLEPHLNEATKTFWNDAYEMHAFNGYKLRSSSLFNTQHDEVHQKLHNVPYLRDKTLYEKARNNCLKFIWHSANINDQAAFMPLLNDMDIILLSNVADYSHLMFKLGVNHVKQFRDTIVKPCLGHSASTVMLAYVYDAFNIFESDRRNPFNDACIRQQLYGNLDDNWTYSEMGVDSAIAGAIKDVACILHKK